MTALEDRLARLDLRLEPTGAHLADERLACVVQGAEPTAAEAGHLAGCDACTELLMAVGVGLEGALAELPGAESWVHAPQAAPAGTAWGVLMGGGALLVSAAALWVALGTGDSVEPAPAPARIIEAAEPTNPSSVTAATAELRSAHNAPSSRAPIDESGIAAAAVASATNETAADDAALPKNGAPVSVAAEVHKAQRLRPAIANKPDDAQAPGSTAMPRGEMRVRGPRPMNARPVDGPPRGSGYLRLAAKPPAQVFIDGKLVGWTPLVDYRLLEGPHDVRLLYESDRARLREERFRVVIEPDRIWRSLRRNLRRSTP